MALYSVATALRSGNISNIANAIRDGVFDTAKAVVNLPVNMVKSVVKSIQTGTVFKAAPPPASVQAVTPNATAAKDTDSADKPAVTPTLAKQVSALKPAGAGGKDKTGKAVAETKASQVDSTKADDAKAGDTKADDATAGNTTKGAEDKPTKAKKDKPKKDKADKADKPKAEKPKKAEKQKKDKAAKAEAAK
jgi:hypothetical protein